MAISKLHLTPEPIPAATRKIFAKYPWCTQLLDDPQYTPVQTYHHTPHPGAPNGLMLGVLFTPDNIEASQSLHRHLSDEQTKELDGGPKKSQTEELITLYALGSGISGWEGIAHGGLVAAILDQQAGDLMFYDTTVRTPRTAYSNIKYSRAMPVPAAVKASAWKTRVEGRKHWVMAELVDSKGQMLASTEVLFIDGQAKI